MKQKNRFPLVIIALLWLSILPGQIFRWELKANSSGLLVSDFAVFLVLLLCVFAYKKELREKLSDKAVRLLLVWGGVLGLSWVLALPFYGVSNAVLAAGYLIRLLAYLALFVVSLLLGKQVRQPFLRYAVIATLGLLALGTVIYIVLPNFASLAAYGWDPHVGRLTSTWLDPNYFGTFLGLAAAASLCWEADYFAKRRSWWLLQLFFFLCVFGIYMTVSRSAVVTLAVAGLLAGLRTSWRATAIAIVAVALLLGVPSRLQSRLSSSLSYVGTPTTTTSSGSGSSTTGSVAPTTDATANERVQSWKRAWELSEHEPVFGIGYNDYQPASLKYGLLSATGETRGTTGSDSSLLTLLATTGWVGMAAFLVWILYLVRAYWLRKTAWTTAALAVIGGLAVGSQLNNALLYPFILLPCILLLGIAYADARG